MALLSRTWEQLLSPARKLHELRNKKMANIDLDRPLRMRVLDGTGIQVYMYIDEPGVFRNAFGQEVSETLAKQAGYEVERLGRERMKREKMKAAFAAIEREMDTASDIEEKVLVERSGYKLVDIGLGRTVITDPDGSKLTTMPVPQELGQKLFDELVPKAEAAPEAPTEPVPEVKVKGKVKENGSASS